MKEAPASRRQLAYLQDLPKKQMAVGVLLPNALRQLLLVKPVYQEHWGLPGGVVEANESPVEAAYREVQEELGLRVRILRCAGVDYFRRQVNGQPVEGLQILFWGALLTEPQIQQIRLQTEELEAYRFVEPGALSQFLPGTVARRLMPLLRYPHRCIYMEHGQPLSD